MEVFLKTNRSIFLVPLLVLLQSAPALADRLWASPQVDTATWDYTPSVMNDVIDGKRKLWWCSEKGGRDVIRYQEWLPDGSRTAPVIVLESNEFTPDPDLAWEGVHTCDPSVIRGNWTVGGNAYSYAMYYTTYSPTMDGGRIGAAFSNDGIHWTKWTAGPVVMDSGALNPYYGTGMSVAWSANAAAGVRMVYMFMGPDAIVHYRYRESTDGINFGSATSFTEVSKTGLDAFWTTVKPGFAFAPGGYDGHYYYYMSTVCTGEPTTSKTTGLCVYRIDGSQLFTGTWQLISTVGQIRPAEFEPGFVTDLYGALPNLPRFELMFGCGDDGTMTFPNPGFMTWALCSSYGDIP